MEYISRDFPGLEKKSRDKNSGQNDTGSRDLGTETLLCTEGEFPVLYFSANTKCRGELF